MTSFYKIASFEETIFEVHFLTVCVKRELVCPLVETVVGGGHLDGFFERLEVYFWAIPRSLQEFLHRRSSFRAANESNFYRLKQAFIANGSRSASVSTT